MLVFGKLREDCVLKASPSYLVRHCLKKQQCGLKSQYSKSYIFIHLKISLLILLLCISKWIL